MSSVHSTPLGTHDTRLRSTSRLKTCVSRNGKFGLLHSTSATALPTVPKPKIAIFELGLNDERFEATGGRLPGPARRGPSALIAMVHPPGTENAKLGPTRAACGSERRVHADAGRLP